MKHSLFKAALLLFFFSSFDSFALPNSDSNEALIKNTITTWMKKNNIPGVAAEVVINGIPHSYYFGYANQRNKMPVDKKTIFEVGSFTKIFTSILMAEELSTGNLKLNESVSPYIIDLASVNPAFQDITFENLATHTTGLPFDVPSEIKTRNELKKYMTTWHPTSPIGSQWAYSNLNIGLLGYALEAKTHQNINQLYRNRILQPLGMAPIGITVPTKYKVNYAQGYSSNGDEVKIEKDWLFPSAGAMKASGGDMLQFLKASIGLPDTPAPILDAIKKTQIGYYMIDDMEQGLGWTISHHIIKNRTRLLNPSKEMNRGPLHAKKLTHPQYDPEALIDKTGGTQGFRSYIALIPNQKTGVVILTNRFVSNGEIISLGRSILFNLH